MTYQIRAGLMTLVLWFGLAATLGASPQSEDTPPTIVLTGVLESKTEWGPPGFGETRKLDSKVVIFALKLREPRTARQLSLPDGGKEVKKRFTEIQLWCDSTAFPQCEAVLKKSVGRRITVGGQPSRAVEPTDYLPVTLRVRSITDR